MGTNKHATIRYLALDRCFSNFGKKFFIEDLINACNTALYDYAGIEDGVKRRQVFDDITFMESEQGWSIPLDRIKDGKRVYYRYSDRSFSINNQGINHTEAKQLKDTLSILSRFKGLPQFEWVEEIQIRLEDTFKLKSSADAVVGFENNPYLRGLNFFTEIFNAVQSHQVLKVIYQGYKQSSATEMTISPWYLKQYNNRWFLFGYNKEFQNISNLAIDRIVSITNSSEAYVINDQINFDEYFDDVIGVSVRKDDPPQMVILRISPEVWPYIKSKPMHGSQRVIDADKVDIQLFVQVNHELVATIFSYMDAIEIIEPRDLRERCRLIAERVSKKNM
jgi:predicted DNA-binding transcriptional regulator YafY